MRVGIYKYGMLTSLLFAGVTIAGKLLLATEPAFLVAGMRFILSSLCLLPFVDYKEFRSITLNHVCIFLGIGFFGIFLFNCLLFNGLCLTSPASASLIAALNPLMTLFVTSLIGFRMPTRRQKFAFFLAFCGVALVVTEGNLDPALIHAGAGELLVFTAVMSNVIYSILMKKITDHFSASAIIFASGMSGLLFLLPLLYTQGIFERVPLLTTQSWLLLGFIGSLGTAVSVVSYTISIKKIGPAMTSLLVFSPMPIFVFIFAFFVFGHSISLWQASGASLVLLSLFLILKE
jgi:drug/metabolite transporter (DMT)-like permease